MFQCLLQYLCMRLTDKDMHKFCFLVLMLFVFSCRYENDEVIGEKVNDNDANKYENDEIKEEKVNDPESKYQHGIFKQYQWIIGTWLDTNTFRNYNPSGHYIEKWKMYNDSVSGLGIKVVNGDSTINEYMSIRIINGTSRK